jgi:drug/metabolite transporter (DMT)-like permease|tara:strand:+ start:227 stop:1126 length:900 start_codon:yes stop_codon:yes gene_type:complete
LKKLNNNYLPYILLLIQPAFMASNLVVARGGVEHVPPISLAFWRWFLVFLILLPFTCQEIFKNIKSLKKELKKLFFLGAMGCGVCGAFPFMAGLTTTVANMGIIYTSSPIFIILISSFFFKEKLQKTQFFGLILCFLGVILIITKGDINLLINLEFTKGDLWMLGAAIGWALYSVFLLNWKSRFSLFTRFTIIAFFGAVSLIPFSIVENIFIQPVLFNEKFYFWTIFAAISPGIIAFSLYAQTQKYLGASVTGFTLYLYTVYGAFYGIFIFHEQLQNYHYYGALLVFAGMFFVKKRIKN